MKSLLLLFLFVGFTIADPSYGLGLFSVSSVASDTTDYYVGISLIADPSNIIDVQVGATMAVMFPTDYTGRIPNGTIACSLNGWGDPFAALSAWPTPSCSASATTVTISNLFTQAYTLNYQFDVTILIPNIVNPLASGATGTFYAYVYLSSGTPVITATGISISPASMTCSLSTSPTTISRYGAVSVQFLTPQFTTSSTITINFNQYWPQTTPQSITIIPALSSVTCSPVLNAASAISCSFAQSGVSNYEGVVSSIVAAGVKATTISFQFGPVWTPPTTMPQGSFLITARNSGRTMSQCTGTVSGMTAGSLSSAQLVPTTSTVNSLTQLTLSFAVNTNIVTSDTITVTFPIEISLSSLTQVYLPSTATSVSPTITGQTLNVTGARVSTNGTLSMTFDKVLNPTSQLPTSTFAIATSRSSFVMDTLSAALTYSATRASIISATLSASNLQIGVTTTYNLQFSIGQPLTANGAVVVGLPTVYQGKVGGCSPSPCSVGFSAVTFTSVATTVGSAISLSLTNVVNPLTIGSTTSLILYTLYSSSQPTSFVEYTNSGLSVSLVARVIPASNIAISSTSQVVSYFPSSFTFTINNVNPLPAYSYLKVYVPNEIGVSAAQVNCQAGSAAVSCTYDLSTRIITFSSFSSAIIAAGGLSSTPVVINNLINPSSTSPTSSFGIYLYNSLDQMLEYQASGLTFTSSQAASFFALNLIPNNTVNSADTSLSVNFALTASSYLNNSLLVVTFPAKINIQLASCTVVSSNLLSVGCSVNSNKMQAILAYSSLSTAQSTRFTIATYKNYPSLQPYQMTVELFADIFQNSKLCTNSNAPASFQNTAVGSITVSSSSFSNPVLLEASNLNFEISSVQGYPFSYLVVSFPAEFGIASTTCSFPAGIICTIQGTSIVINSTTTIALPLVGAINNIIAPGFSPSSNIYLQSFTSTAYTMDSNTQIYFAAACTLPCRGCSSSQPASCTSCYSNAALVQGQIYFSNSSCVSVCGLQLYLSNSTNSCSSCVAPCATCQSSSYCYTCITNYYLYNGSCLLTCPFGYYGFNGLCLACTAAIYCQSCPNSFECSTCLTGYYLYNSQCYQTCPSLITYPNLANRTCDYCPTNCTNCQGNSSNITCTACNTGYVLDNARCYLNCVTSGLIAVNNICQGCTSPCSTCSMLVTNCTGCLSSGSAPYLYGNRCLSQCPDGYYESNTTYSCLMCTSPCELCNNISVHSCLTCISGYYLYQSNCLAVCPLTYYNTSGQCSSCVAPCLACTAERVCTSCVNNTYLYQSQCLSQCPSGMAVVNGNQCLVCNSICRTCSSTTYCESCFNSTYLYNGTCLGSCPAGTYRNVSTLICDSCVFPCASCSNATFCLSCADNTKFVVNGSCVDCTSPCATCTGSIANCTSCLSSTFTPYIFNNSCLALCPSNYYSDNATYTCSLCVSPCLRCNGPSNSSCLSCQGGYYLLGSLCLSVCPATYYSNISVCSSCQAPCLTCSGPGICISCTNSSYLYGSSCVASCGTGLTIFNNSICQYCSTSCQTCLSANSSACTSCYAGAFLSQNTQTCGSTCITGFYPDSSTGFGVCLACVAPCASCTSSVYCLGCLDSSLFLVNGSCLGCLSPCLTCSTLRSNCTSCDASSATPYLYNATCNSGCWFGSYPDSHLCVACTAPCASCFNGSSTACTSCISGYYQLSSTCFSVCPSGYFVNTTICSACVAPCATCSSSSTCLSCQNSFYLLGSSCVSNCSAGMSIINNSKCQYCSSSCSTCQSSNSSACTTCYPTTYLYGSSCLTTCPNGTYQDSTTNVCQPCINPCSLCQSATYCLQCLDANRFLVGGSCVGCTSPCITCFLAPTNCTSCASSTGYPYLHSSTCISGCPGGTYGELSTGQCLSCTSPCQTCTSAASSSCMSCISGYLLFQSTCITACPSGYYSNNVTCLGCSSPCQNCVDNSTCTSCQAGLLLEGSLCVSNCSSGLTAINSTFCFYCSGSCLSCLSSNTSACTSCYSGLYLLGNQCYVDCPSGYYEDAPSSKCILCQNPCSTCLSATLCLSCQDPSLFLANASCLGCLAPCLTCSILRTNCTSCDTTTSFKYLLNSNCLDTCPASTYPSGLNCVNCPSPCDTCANASTSSCLTCLSGYVLMNSTCLLGCPTGYYSNNLTCIPCISPCSTCSSASLCLSCESGKYLLGSQCYSSCPGGMIISSTTNGDICAYCASFCNTCLSANSSYCTSCANGTYLNLGQCLSNCSSGYFPNSVSYTCDLCSSPCATCTSPTSCLSCLLASDFLVGFSCLGCQGPCLSCGAGLTTCTSCNTTGAQPYFYQSNCIASCPATYYASASFNCTLCDSPCYTCTGPGSQSCSTCLFGYLMLNNSCYLSCPGGYYNHSTYCLTCTAPCFTCSGPGTTACTACTSGLYLLGSSCVANCSGLAVSGSSCLYCASSCLTCQTSNSSYCTSCNSGSYLLGGACISNCSSNYYPDNNLWTCMPCVSPCGQCTSATSCLTCIASTKFLVNSSCVGCSSPCYTCQISVNNCTSCDPLSAFPLLFQNSCVGACPDTYYQATSSSCLSCSSPCESCTSAGIHACRTCIANTYLLNSTCYSTCPSGYFASVAVCLSCSSPCSTCQITAATCLSCVSGYLLRGSSCVNNCSSGQVVVNGSYCQVCNGNCLTCLSTNYSFCTSCQNGNYLLSGACSITCPNLTYPDNSTNRCLACIAPCVECSSQTSCISCLSSLFLIGSTCQSCQTPCLTCTGTQTNCTACNTSSLNPYLLLGGCLSSCPGGYYDAGAFSCLPCLNPCSTCSTGNNRSCITCISGYLQLGSDCYLICPTGYYSNSTNCIACNSSLCLTCSLSASTCLSCVAPLYLYGSSCVGSCPMGMIVLNGSICQSCSSNCQTCLTLNNSFCTSCYTNNYLFNGICSIECPDFFYPDVSGSCLRCLSPCAKCQSVSSCLSCSNALHFLQNFTCVSACSYPLVGINGTCYQCSSQCFTCTQTVSTCLLCANNFYYFPARFACELVCSYFILPKNISSSGNNQCTQTCPAGTYANPNTSYCVPCPSACSLCVSAINCSQCATGYSYYLYFCYDPCPAMAPYSINYQCIMCNISNCQTCLNTTYCSVCIQNYLLIAEGNASKCISSCPSNQHYQSSSLACVNNPVPVEQTNIVNSAVPPYTFGICAISLTFILFIVKFKNPSSHFGMAMMLMINLVASATMANLLYIEMTSSGISKGEFSNVSVATALLLSAGGVQLLSSVGSVIAAVKIRDPELIKVWQNYPISFVVIMVVSLVDSNFIFLTTTGIFNLELFQANLSSAHMMAVLKFSLVSSLLVKSLSLVYSAMQLMFYNSNAYRLLAEAVSFPIENSATIQFLIISLFGVGFVVYLLCIQGKEEQEQGTKEQSHQSLMDQANAFDKRLTHDSNAHIVMSDHDGMVIDLNSLDEEHISEVPSSKRVSKKITPDQMLQRMGENQQNQQNQIEGEDLVVQEIVFVQEEGPQSKREEKEIDQAEEPQEGTPHTHGLPTSEEHRENDLHNESLFFAERSLHEDDLPADNPRIADISEIVCPQVPVAQKSKTNIFEPEQINDQTNQQQKHKTFVLDLNKEDNAGVKIQPEYSPSQISKYKPNQEIANQFAQNSYLDDANRFNEHYFEKQKEEAQNKITFQIENNDYFEGAPEDYSFQKKKDAIDAEHPEANAIFVRKKPEKVEPIEQEIKLQPQPVPQPEPQHFDIAQIEEEEDYKQTPEISTPIVNTYIEDIEDEDEFRPSEGLKGKRKRDQRRKPQIPLPKNQTEKDIISIYHKKPKEKRSPHKRYANMPPIPSKNSNYVQYSMQENEFAEEKKVFKPIFSGEIKRDAASRYKSIEYNQNLMDEEMPAKPSLKLRKSSFKKIGEMIVQSQASSRK